jgi:serine/threonine-protein kinase RsbT
MGLSGQKVTLRYTIAAEDFISAGEASSHVKKTLNKLGIRHELIKRFTIAMYEAEINTVIHASGGEAYVEITPEKDFYLDMCDCNCVWCLCLFQ